jgi:hypothetical protein
LKVYDSVRKEELYDILIELSICGKTKITLRTSGMHGIYSANPDAIPLGRFLEVAKL